MNRVASARGNRCRDRGHRTWPRQDLPEISGKSLSAIFHAIRRATIAAKTSFFNGYTRTNLDSLSLIDLGQETVSALRYPFSSTRRASLLRVSASMDKRFKRSTRERRGTGPDGIFSASVPMARYPNFYNVELDPHKGRVVGGLFSSPNLRSNRSRSTWNRSRNIRTPQHQSSPSSKAAAVKPVGPG